ncbi:unnamed protein product [Linum tenue]|uniref:Cytochrome P450 n=1 Tax=Linum tenue TaxID=586396 RepID=A0AAV0NY92_9ROSI|nr:unnamed protein product [Linum tenue]
MMGDMVASVEMMLERWKEKEGAEVEIYEELRTLTSEVISRTAFGSSFEEGKQIFGMLHKMMALAETNMYTIRLPLISNIFKTVDEMEAERLDQGIADSIIDIVKKREEKVKCQQDVDSNGYGSDYLGLLIQAHHDEDETKKISMEQLIDECRTLYAAGQETANAALSWMILLLAIHRDWQEKVRNEVISIFGHEKCLDFDGIARLKIVSKLSPSFMFHIARIMSIRRISFIFLIIYLLQTGMFILETLRLYTPVYTGFIRDIGKEATLGKLTGLDGVQCHIPFIMIHHDPKIWGEDVHAFKPERFLDGIAKATNNNPTAFMPFGMGHHICAGSNFAINEAKITIAMILQRYSLTLSPGYVHAPHPGLTLRPAYGIQIILNAL